MGIKYRSKFEARVAAAMPPGTQYEPEKLFFPVADPGYRCKLCGSKEVIRKSSYTPDFRLPNGRYIEAKGKITAQARRRMVAWKAHYPHLTVRFVFMADNKISKVSTTRYSDWAKKAGFEYCVGVKNIPKGWLK